MPRRTRLRLEPLEDRTTPVVNPANGGNPVAASFVPAVGRVHNIVNTSYGTGTLIAPRWVLTAAHVISGNLDVWGSDYRFTVAGQTYNVVERNAVTQLAYGIPADKIDDLEIALIKLDRDVPGVTPVPIWRGALNVGQQVTMVGYGRTGTPANPLREAPDTGGTRRAGFGTIDARPGIVDTDGQPYYPVYRMRFDGGSESSTGRGDSGGPLLFRSSGRYYVAGVTSHFESGNWETGSESNRDYGAQVGAQSDYLRTDFFQGWIDRVMAGGGATVGNPRFVAPSGTQQAGVQDVTAPTLGPLPDLTVRAVNDAGAAVTFPVPSVSDDYDAAPAVTYSHVPGSVFPVGTTRVTVTTTDASGNARSSAFDVVVLPGAPVPAVDSYRVDRRAFSVPAAEGVLANDSSPWNRPLVASVTQVPAHGTLTLLPDGAFSYTPQAGYTGTDSFTYTVSDGVFSPSSPVTVTLALDAVPAAGSDSFTIRANSSLTDNVLLNDRSAYDNPLLAQLVASPAHGTLTFDADGTFTYVPAAGYSGPDSFTYRAIDGTLVGGTTAVSLVIDHPPVACADAFTVAAGQTTEVSSADGLMANDTDQDGPTLLARLIAGPGHGTLWFSADGAFKYTPASGYTGPDSFTYVATDGYFDSSPVTVALTVERPPEAAGESHFVYRGEALTLTAEAGLLANDRGYSDRAMSVVPVGPIPSGMTLNPDGSFTYTPPSNTSSLVEFWYCVTDGGLTTAAVKATFNVWWMYARPDDYHHFGAWVVTVAPDTPYRPVPGYGVRWNDWIATNPLGLTVTDLTVVLDQGPAHGTVALDGDGLFTYTPAAGYHGPDRFTYRLSDGMRLSEPAEVVLAVRPRDPVADSYQVARGATLTLAASAGLLANDPGGVGSPMTVALEGGAPAAGTLSLNADGSFTWTPPSPTYEGIVTFRYTVGDGTSRSDGWATVTITAGDLPVPEPDTYTLRIDDGMWSYPGVLANDLAPPGRSVYAELVAGPQHARAFYFYAGSSGVFSYTPQPGFTGIDTFTYRAVVYIGDGQYLRSDPTLVTLRVKPHLRLTDDSFVLPVNGRLDVPASAGLLANDTDPWGDSLRAFWTGGPGWLSVNDDGSFAFTPPAGFVGSTSFTYYATDSGPYASAVVTFTVGEAPAAADDAYRQGGWPWLDVPAVSGVLANDLGRNGLPLTAELVDGPDHGSFLLRADGSFLYWPSDGYQGEDAFTYRARDGEFASADVTVRLTVLHPPVSQSDAYRLLGAGPLVVPAGGVLANDTGFGTLRAERVSGPTHGTLTLFDDGSFTYTPEPGFTGDDGFTYRAHAADVVGPLTVVTLRVDRPPVAVADAFAVPGGYYFYRGPEAGVLANDTRGTAGWTRAELIEGPSRGTLWFGDDGSFTYSPGPIAGPATFRYRLVSGDIASEPATVTLNVSRLPPASSVDAYVVPGPWGLRPGVTNGVLANDISPNGTPLTAKLVGRPAHGTLTLNPDGSFAYIPEVGFTGTDRFIYRVSDGTLVGSLTEVTLTTGFAWSKVWTVDVTGDRVVDRLGQYGADQWWVTAGGATSLWQVRPGTTSILVGDVNGDRRADVLTLEAATGRWFAGLSTGAGFRSVLWAVWTRRAIWADARLGDFNGDGRQDLFGWMPATRQLWVGLSGATGARLVSWATWPRRPWVDVRVVDVNGDGRADVLARDLIFRTWQIGLSNGRGRFTFVTSRTDPLLGL